MTSVHDRLSRVLSMTAGETVMRSQANGGGFGVLSTFASLGDFLSAPYVRIGEPPNAPSSPVPEEMEQGAEKRRRYCPVIQIEGVFGSVAEGGLEAAVAGLPVGVQGSFDAASFRVRYSFNKGFSIAFTQGISGGFGVPPIFSASGSLTREIRVDAPDGGPPISGRPFTSESDSFIGFEGGFAVIAGGNARIGYTTDCSE